MPPSEFRIRHKSIPRGRNFAPSSSTGKARYCVLHSSSPKSAPCDISCNNQESSETPHSTVSFPIDLSRFFSCSHHAVVLFSFRILTSEQFFSKCFPPCETFGEEAGQDRPASHLNYCIAVRLLRAVQERHDLRLQRRLRIHRQIQFLFRLLCRTFLAGTTKIFSVAHIHIYVMCLCNRILQFR